MSKKYKKKSYKLANVIIKSVVCGFCIDNGSSEAYSDTCRYSSIEACRG